MLLQTRTALSRGVPCYVRKVNCALNQTQRRKTLIATAARVDVSGGCTAFVAVWLMMTTKITASAARASPRPASANRQQQTALRGHNLNARRPRMGGVGSKGCLIFEVRCLSCLSFFSLRHRSGCARQTRENLSRRREGGGYSCSCSVFYCCRRCAFWIYFISSFSFCNIEVGNEEWDLVLNERVLYKQFVPSQLSRVHDVLVFLLSPLTSSGEAAARNATTVSCFKTNSCGLHRLEPHVSQERKSAHAHAGTSLNSSSIDPFRSLLTPQAWALHHKSISASTGTHEGLASPQ